MGIELASSLKTKVCSETDPEKVVWLTRKEVSLAILGCITPDFVCFDPRSVVALRHYNIRGMKSLLAEEVAFIRVIYRETLFSYLYIR